MKKIILLSLVAVLLLTQVNAQTISCNANFSWNMSGTTVKFIPDLFPYDTVGVYHQWSFGDGSSRVVASSPYHTFPVTGGTYIITHVITRYNPNTQQVCKDSVLKELIIPQDCVIPNFTYQPTLDSYLKIKFSNTSLNYNSTDSIAWMFGDGTTSNDINPTHTYTSAGVYRVCLLIKKRNTPNICIKEKCYEVIVARPCDIQANFNWQKDPVTFNKVYFANATVNFTNTDSLTWSFGDGTYSHNLNPDHIYANAGKYTVCLTVKRKYTTPGTAVCVDSTCKTLEIAVPDCNIVPGFISQAVSPSTTQIKFTNTTTGLLSTDSVKWSFGDGTYSKDISPTHNYTTSGTYVVVMEVKRIGSAGQILCIKNITKEIHVSEACTFTPNFSYRSDSAIGNPYKFYFENTSSTTINTYDSLKWNFGDGTDSLYNGRTATHTFANAGTYNVCLLIIKLDNNHQPTNCAKYVCKTITILPSCDLTIGYSWKTDSINKKKIIFTATSNLPTGTTAEVNWGFGDNSPAGSGWTTAHEYAASGKYYVCVRIQNGPNCIKYKCDSITVANNTIPCEFVPSYTSAPDATNKKKIIFTNTTTFITTGANAIATWNFGDGSPQVNGWNATHEYLLPGRYAVCVRIQYSSSCVKEKCDSITVTDNPVVCDFVASYTWKADSLNKKKIFFTNTTLAPTPNAIATWTFGDGTETHTWSPVHEYAQAGKYYVCLKVQYGTSTSCIKYKCDSVTVPPVSNCDNYSLFTYSGIASTRQYSFTPVYQNNDVQYTWTFGDGTGSLDMNATHQFANSTAYQVCLTAFRNNNCAFTTCKEIRVAPVTNCDSVKLAYQYYRDQYMPNKIHFYAYTNTTTIQQQVWTIYKDGTASSPITITQINPVYTFTDTGHYYVCLKVTAGNGCVKEYCSIVNVERIADLCELQAYPNPVNSQVSINVEEPTNETIHAYIYNSLNILVGEKHQAGYAGANIVSLYTANLPAGFYTIKIIYGNKVCFARFQKI